MKQLHEYETPRVDECEMTPSLHLEDNVVYSDTARDLEQRLACAVEALEEIEMKSENHFKAVAMAARALPIIKS